MVVSFLITSTSKFLALIPFYIRSNNFSRLTRWILATPATGFTTFTLSASLLSMPLPSIFLTLFVYFTGMRIYIGRLCFLHKCSYLRLASPPARFLRSGPPTSPHTYKYVAFLLVSHSFLGTRFLHYPSGGGVSPLFSYPPPCHTLRSVFCPHHRPLTQLLQGHLSPLQQSSLMSPVSIPSRGVPRSSATTR